MREYADWGLWDTDRMHMSPAGHQRMAARVSTGDGLTARHPSLARPHGHGSRPGRSVDGAR